MAEAKEVSARNQKVQELRDRVVGRIICVTYDRNQELNSWRNKGCGEAGREWVWTRRGRGQYSLRPAESKL